MKNISFSIGSIILTCVIFGVAANAENESKKPTETGTVIFYRTRSAKGGAIRLNITGGEDKTVGLLSNGSKIVKEFPVGEHTFVVSSPSIAGRDSVTIKVEPGKTYYVKGEAKLGWPAARSRFSLMDEKKGKAESDKIEPEKKQQSKGEEQ